MWNGQQKRDYFFAGKYFAIQWGQIPGRREKRGQTHREGRILDREDIHSGGAMVQIARAKPPLYITYATHAVADWPTLALFTGLKRCQIKKKLTEILVVRGCGWCGCRGCDVSLWRWGEESGENIGRQHFHSDLRSRCMSASSKEMMMMTLKKTSGIAGLFHPTCACLGSKSTIKLTGEKSAVIANEQTESLSLLSCVCSEWMCSCVRDYEFAVVGRRCGASFYRVLLRTTRLAREEQAEEWINQSSLQEPIKTSGSTPGKGQNTKRANWKKIGRLSGPRPTVQIH